MGLDRVAWHALWPNSVISKYTDPHSQPFGGGGGGGGGGFTCDGEEGGDTQYFRLQIPLSSH